MNPSKSASAATPGNGEQESAACSIDPSFGEVERYTDLRHKNQPPPYQTGAPATRGVPLPIVRVVRTPTPCSCHHCLESELIRHRELLAAARSYASGLERELKAAKDREAHALATIYRLKFELGRVRQAQRLQVLSVPDESGKRVTN